MLIRHIRDCEEFIAEDDSLLRELIHPDKHDVDLRYSFAHAEVEPAKTTKPHKLKVSEVYYILEGKAIMHIDDEKKEVGPGCLIYIPPKSIQYIKNTGTTSLKFICIVDPAWRRKDEEILD